MNGCAICPATEKNRLPSFLKPKQASVTLTCVGTIRAGGVRFRVHPQDHEPVHVHGRYAESVVIVQLYADGSVGLANREDAIIPRNARASDVRRILKAASTHYEDILAEWQRMQEQ